MDALKILIDLPQPVSGLFLNPPAAQACFAFAHGAGAGITHPFMEAVAAGLCERGIATLRYQFPYMERMRSAPTLRPPPTRRCARPSQKRRGDARRLRSSPAANRSAPG
jgi:predicted alpha/beta-hydrolase family hydrolase